MGQYDKNSRIDVLVYPKGENAYEILSMAKQIGIILTGFNIRLMELEEQAKKDWRRDK